MVTDHQARDKITRHLHTVLTFFIMTFIVSLVVLPCEEIKTNFFEVLRSLRCGGGIICRRSGCCKKQQRRRGKKWREKSRFSFGWFEDWLRYYKACVHINYECHIKSSDINLSVQNFMPNYHFLCTFVKMRNMKLLLKLNYAIYKEITLAYTRLQGFFVWFYGNGTLRNFVESSEF